MNRNVIFSVVILLVAFGGWWWLRPTTPAMSSDSFQFVMATYRATQAKNLDQLEQISRQLESQKLSTGDCHCIEKIIKVARSGDWELASKQAFSLMKSQRRY